MVLCQTGIIWEVHKQLWLLERLLIFIVVSVPVITAAGFLFGPEPFVQSSKLLVPPNQGLVETRDVFILLGWLLVGGGSSLFLFWRLSETGSEYVLKSSSVRLQSLTFFAIFVFVVICNLFIDWDKRGTGNVPVLTISEALGSLLLVIIASLIWFRAKLGRNFFRLILAAGLLVRPLSIFLQTPSSLRDPEHFFFTANELATPAAGMFPLINFIPQYTSLLGFPIAPILRLIPDESLMIVLLWVHFLEVICLAFPIVFAYQIRGRHAALVATVVIASLMTVRPSANSYFQTFPIRTVFTCFVIWFMVARSEDLQNRRFRTLAYLGVLSGLTLLNNLESGLPCVFAMLFTTFLLQSDIRKFLVSCAMITLGIVLVFSGFVLAVFFTGRSVEFSYLIYAIQIFGVSGYMKEPMAVGGFHNIYTIFFISGMLVSIFLFSRARSILSFDLKRIATMMSFASFWGLANLIYFSGRSFTSTLTGSSNYPLGLLAVAIILWIFADKEFLFTFVFRRPVKLLLLPCLVCSLFFYLATMSLFRMDAVHVLRQSGMLWDEEVSRTNSLNSVVRQVEALKKDKAEGSYRVGQVLPLSNILELTSGIEASLVVSHPEYLALSFEFQAIQCKYLIDSNLKLIVETFDLFIDKPLDGSLTAFSDCSVNWNSIELKDQDIGNRVRLLGIERIVDRTG